MNVVCDIAGDTPETAIGSRGDFRLCADTARWNRKGAD